MTGGELQAREVRLAEYAGLYPALTWAGHRRPAVGVWRGYLDVEQDQRGLGQLVAIRGDGHGMVLVTFEDGVRVEVPETEPFRVSPLSDGVSLPVARQLLDAVAGDVPEVLGERLTALRHELDGQTTAERSWLASGPLGGWVSVAAQTPPDGIGVALGPVLERLARLQKIPDFSPAIAQTRRVSALLELMQAVATDLEQLVGEVQIRRDREAHRAQAVRLASARAAAGCDHPEGAGTRCGRCGKDVAELAGGRLRPDARERAARWLWRADTGGDSAWGVAGELRRPFYEQADGLLAELTTE